MDKDLEVDPELEEEETELLEGALVDPQWVTWDRAEMVACPFNPGDTPLVTFAGPGGVAFGLYLRED